MSVQSEINRLNQAKNSLKTAIDGKGVAVPDSTKLDGYGGLVEQIIALSDVPVYNGETDPDTPGGGGDVDPPADGKTRLYITVPANAMPDRPPPRNQVPLHFRSNKANGVTIDWGDGSPTEISQNFTERLVHTYERPGDYVISFDLEEGCYLDFGTYSSGECVMGYTSGTGLFYCCMLKKAYIGENVTDIMAYAFQYCHSLSSITISDKVESIGKIAFSRCYSISSITIPDGVTSIGDSAFFYCYGMKEYHFLSPTPPTLGGARVFNNIPSDCVIYVPVGSAEAYKTATNWTTVADHIQEEPA